MYVVTSFFPDFPDFPDLIESGIFNRKNVIILVTSRSELVENDTQTHTHTQSEKAPQVGIELLTFRCHEQRTCCTQSYARFFIKPEVTDQFCWF